MMKFVRVIPIPICGLVLGLAALGNLLLPYGENIRYLCGVLSAIVLIVFALKLFLDSPHALSELKTPVPLSVVPTSTMALMLLCTYIKPFIGNAAVYLWYVAVAAHLFLMVLFFKRFIIGFKIATVYPSWFIAFVGIVVVSVTAPAMNARPIGQAAFYTGFGLYFVALALILTKMSKGIFVLEPLQMTTAIFTAPMSLCIVGYFNSFQQRSPGLIYTMLAIAVISYLYVTFKMLSSLLWKGFYPTWSAFTFPYVISALAFRLCNGFLVEQGITFFAPVAQISMWIAVAIVAYVFLHYIRFFRYVLQF